ncbi:ABC transporter permease [Carboxydocella sp. JDF658]|uniref:ABC transporter permease n=1 Tax=Carboxydocella sp. JDF658 TaxID=1926600 RepID=UPI0009ABAE09|nr:iron export ABC transporter permease subunit FetB [Carboxydocella sp. JDF658]GAW31603.1 iron export ABC transporter permease subunit FetB [Carboxydocella sp. JDF658]
MNNLALVLASSLVILALFLSRAFRLGLEKEMLAGVGRAVIQLLVIGMLLNWVFARNRWYFTLAMIGIMVIIAGGNAARRGEGIPRVKRITILSIATGVAVPLLVLVLTGAIKATPKEMIPVAGMLAGNAMVASGLVLKNMKESMVQQREEIMNALYLGATIAQSVAEIRPRIIKTGMLPTIDGLRTLGLVQLPGMMTGLILGGVSPLVAVKYQIMVAFMLLGAVSITSIMVILLALPSFFTANASLNENLLKEFGS